MIVRQSLFLIVLLLSISAHCLSQINQSDTLPFSQQELDLFKEQPDFVRLPTVNMDKLKAEDLGNQHMKNSPWRFGYNHKVEFYPSISGEWISLGETGRLWQLAIESPGALFLNIEFGQFQLAKGAMVFIYNQDRSEFLGPFTYKNNKTFHSLSTAMIRGDRIIIEFFEPNSVKGQSELSVTRVTHGYRDLFHFFKDLGDSGPCNNNVACPEADAWRDQIRSVVMIIVNGNGICTGTLVNNTCQDGTPYVLTANHCGTDVHKWVFQFNWESPHCDQNMNGPVNQTISGAYLRANHILSDFVLAELSSIPPEEYQVYYSGWDRTGSISTSQVSIHHPRADIKKISFDHDPVTAISFEGLNTWEVSTWDDGTTEPGSSGAGLWDQNGRLIGQLMGGNASCSKNSSDYFGSLADSWIGDTPSTRLMDWLDGCQTEDSVLNGMNGIVPSPGTSLIVTNSGDSGPGSLRQTIYDAEPGDTIRFSSGIDGDTLRLTSGQILIDKDLVIIGNGVMNTVLDGNHASRVMESNFTLQLYDLTIQSGGFSPNGFSANQGILFSGTIPANANIEFKSAAEIKLLPNFQVIKGGQFTAEIGICEN